MLVTPTTSKEGCFVCFQDASAGLIPINPTKETAGSSTAAEELEGLTLTPLEPMQYHDTLPVPVMAAQATESEVEVTGVVKGSGVLQVKQEPPDPEVPSLGAMKQSGDVVGRGTVDMEDVRDDEHEEEDDDVIYVDTATTFKYLTGDFNHLLLNHMALLLILYKRATKESILYRSPNIS